jgi:hypothetical protein
MQHSTCSSQLIQAACQITIAAITIPQVVPHLQSRYQVSLIIVGADVLLVPQKMTSGSSKLCLMSLRHLEKGNSASMLRFT